MTRGPAVRCRANPLLPRYGQGGAWPEVIARAMAGQADCRTVTPEDPQIPCSPRLSDADPAGRRGARRV